MEILEAIFGILSLAILAGIYFLPTIVAWWFNHKQTLAIFLTNLLLGWTFLGWIFAIIWAAKEE